MVFRPSDPRSRIEVYTEGCLDAALAKIVVESAGFDPVVMHVGGGWSGCVGKAIEFAFESGYNIAPAKISIFIDADAGVHSRLGDIKQLILNKLSRNNWNINDINVVDDMGNSSEHILGGCIDVEATKSGVTRRVIIPVVMWVDPLGGDIGSSEHVVKRYLIDKYSCNLGEYSVVLCDKCRHGSLGFMKAFSKVWLIAVLAACLGGTLVMADEGSSGRCGVDVYGLLKRSGFSSEDYIKMYSDFYSKLVGYCRSLV